MNSVAKFIRPSSLLILILLFVEIPVSMAAGERLFFLERTMDNNQIIYNVNLEKNNQLNTDQPITIFWIKRTEGNKVEPLTWLQNKYGYGLHYLSKSENSARFHFASYPKRHFELRRDSDGRYKVFTNSGNNLISVSRIFIHNNGGTFLAPKISSIDIYGTNEKTGEQIVEKMKF